MACNKLNDNLHEDNYSKDVKLEDISVQLVDENKHIVASSLADTKSKDVIHEAPTKKKARKRAFKRRRNFTKDDEHNVLLLFYDKGLSIREIMEVMGMSTGSIHLRVEKAKSKYPERRRNVDITDELIEKLKDLYSKKENLDVAFQ